MSTMTEKLKFALCGCGHIAPKWLKAISENPNIELVAIADPDQSTFKKIQEYSFPDVGYYFGL